MRGGAPPAGGRTREHRRKACAGQHVRAPAAPAAGDGLACRSRGGGERNRGVAERLAGEERGTRSRGGRGAALAVVLAAWLAAAGCGEPDPPAAVAVSDAPLLSGVRFVEVARPEKAYPVIVDLAMFRGDL